MRNIINLNKDWLFVKDSTDITVLQGENVNLPHSWNATDGMDGGNDYFRGYCVYRKTLNKADLPAADLYYLELRGTNASADVYVGGEKLAHHDGGYSTWRVNITEKIADETEIAIVVENTVNETVYPQMADFTFYGGIYRDVNLIAVNKAHFDLDYYGGTGLMITPTIEGNNANVEVKVFVKDVTPAQKLVYTIYDKEENEVAKIESTETTVNFSIENVHLWHGRKDPYLYCCEVEIVENGEVLDNVCSRFGCRTFKIDPNNGFILNGEEYPLRGVSRHQDRWGFGNALLPEHHEEDMDLICEMGATTIRLAHYQHDQYFYDLCDERGLVIWAEIPYISRHMPTGRENTITQMKELVTQNYNHASIVVWGLSNEISIGGSNEDLLENHRILNDLCHEMDKTRLTTIAAVSMCKMVLKQILGGAADGDLVGKTPNNDRCVVVVLGDEFLHLGDGVLTAGGHVTGNIGDFCPNYETALVAQIIEVLIMLIVSETNGGSAHFTNEVHIFLVVLGEQSITEAPSVLVTGNTAQGIFLTV